MLKQCSCATGLQECIHSISTRRCTVFTVDVRRPARSLLPAATPALLPSLRAPLAKHAASARRGAVCGTVTSRASQLGGTVLPLASLSLVLAGLSEQRQGQLNYTALRHQSTPVRMWRCEPAVFVTIDSMDRQRRRAPKTRGRLVDACSLRRILRMHAVPLNGGRACARRGVAPRQRLAVAERCSLLLARLTTRSVGPRAWPPSSSSAPTLRRLLLATGCASDATIRLVDYRVRGLDESSNLILCVGPILPTF